MPTRKSYSLKTLLIFAVAVPIAVSVAMTLYCGAPFAADALLPKGWVWRGAELLKSAFGFTGVDMEGFILGSVGLPAAALTCLLSLWLMTWQEFGRFLAILLPISVLSLSIYFNGMSATYSHLPYAVSAIFAWTFAALLITFGERVPATLFKRSKLLWYANTICLGLLLSVMAISSMYWRARMLDVLGAF